MKIEDTEVTPLCPHCEHDLETIHKVSHGPFEQNFVYLCPHCRKVLAITLVN